MKIENAGSLQDHPEIITIQQQGRNKKLIIGEN